MTMQHDTADMAAQTLELVMDELQQRITTLEIEVAHWERTCRSLSAEVRALAPDGRHCRTGRRPHGDGGRSG